MEAAARKIRSGTEYDHLFPRALMINKVYKKGATLSDTLHLIPKVVDETKWQVKGIAKELKGKTVRETCNNIWNFVFEHINYNKDEEGKEQIRSPARAWADRKKGVDCDCYTVFICSILSVLRIPFLLRITKYSQDYFQHIYPIVPLANGDHITIDCVLKQFDYEEPYTDKRDMNMELEILSGIEQSRKPYNDREALEELGRILKKAAARKSAPKSIPKPAPATKQPIRPPVVSKRQSPIATKTPVPAKRPAPPAAKPKKVKGIKKVLKKAGTVVKKAGTVAKKAGTAVKKVTHVVAKVPLSLLRNGLLAALKVNAGNVAGSLRWTYLTDAQAKSKGADMSKYSQMKKTRERLEKIFYTAGGNQANLKSAILKGKGNSDKAVSLAGMSGMDGYEDESLYGELGVAGAASAAAVIATIAAVIKKIGNIFPKKSEAANTSSFDTPSSDTSSFDTSSSTSSFDTTSSESSASADYLPSSEEGEYISPSSQESDSISPAIEESEFVSPSVSEEDSSTFQRREASEPSDYADEEENADAESSDSESSNSSASEDDNRTPPGGLVSEDEDQWLDKPNTAGEVKPRPSGKEIKKATPGNKNALSFWEANKSWLKPVGIGVGAIGIGIIGYKLLTSSSAQSKPLSGVVKSRKKNGKHKKGKPKRSGTVRSKVIPLALM